MPVMLRSPHTIRFHAAAAAPAGDTLNLSMVLSPGSLMYGVFGNGYAQLHELGHADFEPDTAAPGELAERVAVLMADNGLLRRPFSKVQIALLNSDFSLVPEAFSTEDDALAWLQFSAGTLPGVKTGLHRLRGLAFYYGMDAELRRYFEKQFPNANLRHAGAVSCALLFTQHSLLGTDLFLHVHAGVIELSAKRQDSLVFYNVFPYAVNEDILYYLLFTVEQLRLDPALLTLAIAGQLPANAPLLENIRRYIRQVRLCAQPPALQLPGEAASLPAHYYFTILNQHLCEL